MTTEARRVPRPSPGVPGLRAGTVAALGVAALTGSLAAAAGGSPQVLGALVGAGIVEAFFLFGTVSVAFAAAYAPGLSLFVALSTYVLQASALALVLATLRRSPSGTGHIDVRWLAAAVIVGTLAWTGALVAHALRRSGREVPG